MNRYANISIDSNFLFLFLYNLDSWDSKYFSVIFN